MELFWGLPLHFSQAHGAPEGGSGLLAPEKAKGHSRERQSNFLSFELLGWGVGFSLCHLLPG